MKRARGFTLIEVLIALVILSVAFSAMIFSVNQQVRNLQFLKQKTESLWVASNVMAQAQIGLLSGSLVGQEIQLDHTWYWQLTTEPTQNNTIERVRVGVKATANGPVVTELTGFSLREAQ